MGNKTEFWDLFNLDGSFAKRMKRGEYLIPPHLYHKTVEVIPTDKQGHLLVTRRSLTKAIGGGKYEFPAGSVISGEEPYEAAKRELMEETGLRAVRLYKMGESRVPGMRKFIYLAYIPDLLQKQVQLQKGETIGYKFITYDEWLSMIASGYFEVSRTKMYSESIFSNLQKMVGRATTTPVQRPPLRLVNADGFVGTRSGFNGEDSYKKYVCEDAELEPLEPVFGSPEADEIDTHEEE